MTGTDLCVLLYTSVPVIFEPPCNKDNTRIRDCYKKYYNIIKRVKNEAKENNISTIR